MTYHALMLVAEGEHAVIKIEVNGEWVVLIKERLDAPFSQIIEHNGLENAVAKSAMQKLEEPIYRGPSSHCKACEDEAAGVKHIQAAKHTCRKNKNK